MPYTISQNLNIRPKYFPHVVVHVSAGDANIPVHFSIYDGASTYTIPSGTTITVHGYRKDGGNWIVNGTYSGNVVSFTLPRAAMAIEGAGIADVVFTIGNEVVGSANFCLLVERATFPNGVAYSNDSSVFQDLLNFINSSAIPEAISDWLEENITATSPAIDSTLSVQGAAADAKATGDALTNKSVTQASLSGNVVSFKNANNSEKFTLDLSDLDDLGNVDERFALVYDTLGTDEPQILEATGNLGGFLSSGGVITASTSTKIFYAQAEGGKTYQLSIAAPISDGWATFIGEFSTVPVVGSSTENFVRVSTYSEPLTITMSADGYIAFAHGYWESDDDFVVSETVATGIVDRLNGIYYDLSKVRATLYGGHSGDSSTEPTYVSDDDFTSVASSHQLNATIRPVTGQKLSPVSSASSDVFYFNVDGMTSVAFPKVNSTEGNGCAFINSNNTVLESFVYTNTTQREYETVSVPSGARYFVVTWWHAWTEMYDLGMYFTGGGVTVEGLVDRVSALENAERGFLSLDAVPQVPTSTVNAMLKCAYTYIDACKGGNLTYGDGTGTSQRVGTICCSTFCRQLLQGIPYNDYIEARADGTSKSGQRFRYGYRIVGTDFLASDSTLTAQNLYDYYKTLGRAFPTTAAMKGAAPGDLIVVGGSVSSITHIGMFVYRDVNNVAYFMDSSPRNGTVAIKVHPWDSHYTPVGIIRPSLTEAKVTLDEMTASVNGTTWTADLIGYYLNLVKMDYSVTANSAVTLDSNNTFTPTKSGKDYREIVVLPSTDGEVSQTATNVSNLSVKISNYI